MNIFFCGAGGTGKTTVLSLLAEKLQLPVMQSVVRRFYSMRGILSQSQLDERPPEEQVAFQLDLMRFYMDEVEQFSAANPAGMLMDRSIYCHAGYTILADLSSGWDLIRAFRREFERFEDLHPVVIYFPFPPGWYDEEKAKDGFRDVRAAHDVLLDSILYCWLYQAPIKRMVLDLYSSPEERTNQIQQWILEVVK